MENIPSEHTIRQAAVWYARLHAPDCGQAERHAFQKWLESDPSHAQAFASAERAARLITNRLAADARLKALADEALRPPPEPVQTNGGSRILRNQLRYAAMLVMGVGIALFIATLQNRPVSVAEPTVAYTNAELSKRRIELNDGSVVHLDVDSSITVALSSAERRVELNKGRAYFDVAHDSSRPFSVTASGTRVVALGTEFQVELQPEKQTVSVTLAEGSVMVSEHKKRSAWREVLTPGEQLQVDEVSRRHTTQAVNTSRITSWSSGRLVFDATPLNQVLSEINRYSRTKVVLGDASLANVPIGGNFLAGGDTEEFLETLMAVLPLRSIRTGANEIVLFQRHTSLPSS